MGKWFDWDGIDCSLMGKISDQTFAKNLGITWRQVAFKRAELGIPPYQRHVSAGKEKGARFSYYATPAALVAIQSEREKTGDSLSGAINALVLRGAAMP